MAYSYKETPLFSRLAALRTHVIKLLRSDAIWNLTSLGVMGVSGVVLVAILRWDGLETLGIFNQVYAIFIVVSQLGVGGIQFSTLKHISHHGEDLESCSEITISALLLVSAVMLLVLSGLWLLSEPIGNFFSSPGVTIGLRLSIPGLFFFGLNKVLINVVNGLNRIKANSVLRALRFVLLPIIVLLYATLGVPADRFASALTITEALVFLALFGTVFGRMVRLKWPRRLRYWLGQHASFGAKGVLSGILLDLNTRVDVIMLGYFTTDALVGVYSFASTLAEGFAQIPIAVRWSVDPKLGSHFAHGETREIEALSRETRRTLRPWFLLASCLGILGFPLISWGISGQVDYLSWQLYAIMMIGITLSAGYRSFGGILLQGGRPEIYTLVIVGLVVGDALLNLGFIPWLGVTGAAIVTALTYSLEAVYLRISSRRVFSVNL